MTYAAGDYCAQHEAPAWKGRADLFWKNGMDARFHDSHRRLVTTARLSGVIRLVLVVSIFFAILMGFLH